MRQVIHIAMLLGFALASAFAATTPRQQTAVVNRERVNVRGQASINSEIITQLDQGEVVTVLATLLRPASGSEAASRWLKILLPSDTPVWVYAPSVDSSTLTIRRPVVNVRAGPGRNFSVIGTLPQGSRVSAIRTLDDWIEIEAPTNTFAFVAAQFLDIRSQSEAPPSPGMASAPPVPGTVALPATPTVPPPRPAAKPAEIPPTPAGSPGLPRTEPAAAPTPAVAADSSKPSKPAEVIVPTPPPAAQTAKTETPPPALVLGAAAPAPVGTTPTGAKPGSRPQPVTGPVASPAVATSARPAISTNQVEPAAKVPVAAATPPAPASISRRATSSPGLPPLKQIHHPSVAVSAADPDPRRKKRVVTREGRVAYTGSIQAPTTLELLAIDGGHHRLNWLLPASDAVKLNKYLGQRVIVTGEEQMESRWKITPMIVVERIQLAP